MINTDETRCVSGYNKKMKETKKAAIVDDVRRGRNGARERDRKYGKWMEKKRLERLFDPKKKKKD